MSWRIALADPGVGARECEAVDRVLRSGWLSLGPETEAFETEFAARVGARHAVAVSSGTAALHLGGVALGLGPGDEVIAPSLTFVATAAAVRQTGARVVFADVADELDPTIDPAAIERLVGEATRAIVVVHYAGWPCRMEEIGKIAERHGLAVIEDAAHAPGAELDGRALGTLGDVGCFSFFANKNLPVGEGGMVVTGRDDLAARIRRLRSHGMTTGTWERSTLADSGYDVVEWGFNYRIDEIRAALGRCGLVRLDEGNARRRALADTLRAALSGVHGLDLPGLAHRGLASGHLFPILLPRDAERGAFRRALAAAGIQTSVHYPPVHTLHAWAREGAVPSLPVTEGFARREVTLPLHPGLSPADVGFVAEAVKRALPRS